MARRVDLVQAETKTAADGDAWRICGVEGELRAT
jgi:hypothetical protein